MAKKIRFPLKMKDGAEVRSLQELQEYFDIDRVMAYYLNGKLETWLADRHYDEEAGQVRELDPEDSKLSRKLCEIFHVEYVRDALTPEEADARNRRIERLRGITDDEEIIDKVDCVAFSQEELADLLDAGLDTIYLCGKDFQIPLGKRDMTYIGIESKLSFTEEKLAQYHAQNIQFVDLVVNTESIQEMIVDGDTVQTNSEKNTTTSKPGVEKEGTVDKRDLNQTEPWEGLIERMVELSDLMRNTGFVRKSVYVDTVNSCKVEQKETCEKNKTIPNERTVNAERVDKGTSGQMGELFKQVSEAMRKSVDSAVSTEKADKGPSGQTGELFKQVSEAIRKSTDAAVKTEKADKGPSGQAGELFKQMSEAMRKPR